MFLRYSVTYEQNSTTWSSFIIFQNYETNRLVVSRGNFWKDWNKLQEIFWRKFPEIFRLTTLVPLILGWGLHSVVCFLVISFYTVFRKKHPLTFSFMSPWKLFRFTQNFQGMFMTN